MSHIADTVRSEKRIKSIFSVLALVVLPPLIALVILAKLGNVADSTTLDQAQLAQSLAAGHGFVTKVLRPLSVALHPQAQPHPDLINPPVYPALLAAVECLSGGGDKVPPAVGVGLWLVTVWLVYLVCRSWWDGRVGGLAAVLYAASTGAMNAAAGGLPYPLLGFFVLGATWAACPKVATADQEKQDIQPWRTALAGALCGGAVLTDYLLFPFALVLGGYLAVTNERRWRAAGWFAAGLFVVLMPWFARNLMVSDRLFGLYWYGLLTNTGRFPGETIWRICVEPPSPAIYLLFHPLELGRKLVTGLMIYRSAGVNVLEPVGLLLFIVAVFGAQAGSLRKRLALVTTVGAVLSVLLSCLRQSDPRFLLAWLPLIAAVGAAQLAAWASTVISAINIIVWRRITVSALASRLLAYACIAAVVAFPLLVNLMRVRSADASRVRRAMEVVRRQVPDGGVVLTDNPEELAYWLDRPTLWLPQKETDLGQLEERSGNIQAIYISPQLASLVPEQRGDWWAWVASSRGVYRGLVAVGNSPLPGVLRLAQMTKTSAVAAATNELARCQAEIHDNPQSSEAHAQLAVAFAAVSRLRESQQEFQEAIKLDEFNLEAWLGLWQTQAQLNQPDGTLRLAEIVAQSPAQDPRTKPLLEQAVSHFEQAAAQQPNDPWLLFNLLGCRTRLGQWERLQSDYARLATVLPPAFPARFVLANLYLQQGALEKAASECEELLREHPEMAAAHLLLGRVLLAQGRLDNALAETQTAIQLRPQWLSARLQAAQVCQRLKREDEAIEHLETARKLSPNFNLIQLTLAQVYLRQGKTAEAISLYRQVLQTTPQQAVALNNLAELLAKGGQTGDAMVLVHRAVELYPQDPHVRDTAGWVCYLAGHEDEAGQHLREAIRLAPRQGLSQFHLGKVLLTQKRHADALECFRHALECGLTEPDKQDAEKLIAGT